MTIQSKSIPLIAAMDLADAWKRIRWFGAALVVVLFASYQAPKGIALPFDRPVAAAIFATLIIAANVATMIAEHAGRVQRTFLTALFVWDTAVVLALEVLLAFDERNSIWAALVLPIMGGAMLWRLRGALWTGLGTTTLYSFIRVTLGPEQSLAVLLSSQLYRSAILLLIGYFVGMVLNNQAHLIEALRSADSQLRMRAERDDLTGLSNRSTLHERLNEAVARAERGGPAPALLFLDCDDFKTINDRIGHMTGDVALKMLASRLETEIRAGDTAARLSGDEFCVLLQTRTAAVDCVTLAERLKLCLREPWTHNSTTIELSVSVGISLWTPALTAGDVLHRADQAMYQDKQNSRGTVVIR